MKMNDETDVLKRMGIDNEMPDTGCCGMAGAFGFERSTTISRSNVASAS